jgi:hypothetical protein
MKKVPTRRNGVALTDNAIPRTRLDFRIDFIFSFFSYGDIRNLQVAIRVSTESVKLHKPAAHASPPPTADSPAEVHNGTVHVLARYIVKQMVADNGQDEPFASSVAVSSFNLEQRRMKQSFSVKEAGLN